MHKPRLNLLLGRAILSLCALGLLACGGGGPVSLPDPVQNVSEPGTSLQTDHSLPAGPEAGAGVEDRMANVLRVSMPDPSGIQPGQEIEAVISGEFVDEVYQGSMRLQFDPTVFTPVSAQLGALILDEMVYLVSLEHDGFVPFSFTALPGQASIAPGFGELLKVRLKASGNLSGDRRVRLLNNAEFLQLRDRQTQRIKFELESVAGVQQ